MENSRLKNSALNFASGFAGRVLTILLNFIVRTIFIHCLNEAYLSVNGLYSNILTVLSLAELGFGSAVIYRMYEPMATPDYKKAAGLLLFFKKAYGIKLTFLCFNKYLISDCTKRNPSPLIFLYLSKI